MFILYVSSFALKFSLHHITCDFGMSPDLCQLPHCTYLFCNVEIRLSSMVEFLEHSFSKLTAFDRTVSLALK